MIRSKLLYAVLLVVLILFYYLYRGDPKQGDLSLALLIFAVIFPLILLFGLIWLKRSVRLRLFHSKEPVRKGQMYQWVLQITNDSIFSASEAQVSLTYSNSLTGESQDLTLVVPVLAHNSQRVRLSFHTVTCGIMQMQIHELVLFDPLRLFRMRIRPELLDQLLVMPANTVQVPDEWPPVPLPDADTSEYSKVRPGDDPSEIFDLHIYREGDQVSRIHWKLSSKLDHLMVKEYSLPLSAGNLLVPVPLLSGPMPEAALRLDTAYSALTAVAATLSEQELSFALTDYQTEAGMRISELYENLSVAAPWLRMTVAESPVWEHEQDLLLNALTDLLNESRSYERIIIFVPQMNDAFSGIFAGAPHPERLTVFFVTAAGDTDRGADTGMSYTCVPVALQEPEHPAMLNQRDEDLPDYDSEELFEGGAAV